DVTSFRIPNLIAGTQYYAMVRASNSADFSDYSNMVSFVTKPSVGFNGTTASVAEGNLNTKNLVFTVALSTASDVTTKVRYATSDGSATVADGDYQATTGTLTFAPND